LGENLGWINADAQGIPFALGYHVMRLTTHSWIGSLFMFAIGVIVLTLLMHVARGIGRGHARLAQALLVEAGGWAARSTWRHGSPFRYGVRCRGIIGGTARRGRSPAGTRLQSSSTHCRLPSGG